MHLTATNKGGDAARFYFVSWTAIGFEVREAEHANFKARRQKNVSRSGPPFKRL